MDHPVSGTRFMICHDGSQASSDALNTVKELVLKDHDELIVAHVWSRKKEEYLDFRLKRNYIREHTEAECSGMGKRF